MVLRSWPNPARLGDLPVRIEFTLPQAGRMDVCLFDESGRMVRRLGAGVANAGAHVVTWDGRDALGRWVPAGAYWLRLSDGEMTTARQILTIR
jgi:flagellar hook assembly protein FlgD